MQNLLASAMASTMALALFLGTAFYASVRPDVATPMVVLVALAAVLAALRLFLSPEASWKPSPLHWPVAAFLAYTVLRYLASPVEHAARLECLQVALCALAYFVAATQLHRTRDRTLLLATLMVLVILEVAYGIWQCTSHAKTVLNWVRPEGYQFRAGGTFLCPNNYATFLILCLGLLLGHGLLTRLNSRALDRSLVFRILILYGALMAVAGIIASFSRAGWLATIAALLFLVGWGWMGVRLSWPKLAGVGLILALMTLAAWQVDPVRSYLRRTFQMEAGSDKVALREASLGGRIQMWKATAQLIREAPVLGHGIGSWQWVHQRLQHPSIQSHPEHAHNDILQVGAEYGLIGFGLLAWVIVAFFRQAARLRDPRLPSEQRAFAIGAAAGVAGALCHAWFDFPFHIPANSLLLAILVGSVAAIEDPLRPRQPVGAPARRGLAAAFLLLAVALVVLQLGPARAAHYAHAANQARVQDVLNREVPLQLYQRAIAADPRYPEPHWKLGDLYRSQAGWMLALSPEKAAEGRRLAEVAVGHYQRALDLNPLNTEVLVRQGAALELLGEDDRALANYQRAVAVAPANAYNHNALGRHYRKRGDERQALVHFGKAQVLNNWTDVSSQLNLIELETSRDEAAPTNAPAAPPR
ncbi:MAG: hypothetical protein RJA22_484 [Verrucomicrobiota bacterium]